jgi:hypothetical protein
MDFECQSSPIARDFLRTMMKNDIVAQNSARLTAGKFPMFPALPSSTHDVKHWEPQVKDVFSAYTHFPPMLITEPGYSGSGTVRRVRHVIDAIESIPPVDEWYAQMSKAKEQHKTMTGNPKEKTWSVAPHPEFFRRLARKCKKMSL